MSNPYLIAGPAMISFSGGRTSAFMLHEILRAHDGKLPADVLVAFANTGKEREETLRFVHECSARWDVKVHWLERLPGGGLGFVGLNSASRQGEPFQALIREKQRLPNWQERWCTEHLKVRPLFAFAQSCGWQAGQYAEVVGLRNDEGHRILKGLARAEAEGRRMLYPLAKAKVSKATVMAFWAGQDFDLGLLPYEGNCDYCFLKGRGIRKRLIRDGKTSPAWWIEQEQEQNGWFDRRDQMADLVDECRRSPELFDEPEDLEYDVECGLTCAPMESA
jgi:3'-phosphoadenosine 5'-phosphosulfate sulfotransferase (PAPS reductase)/FAD synthetase